MTEHRLCNTTQALLVEIVEQELAQRLSERVRVMDLDTTALEYFSTHPVFRLNVKLDRGRHIDMILKQVQPGEEQDRRREVLLYQHVLRDRRFDAPLLYASLYDEAREHYWVLLEDVGEWRLEYCAIDEWFDAFRWLGCFHTAYYGNVDALRALNVVRKHDRRFYWSLAAGARASLIEHCDVAALNRFDALMQQLDHVIDYLQDQPHTLVHGDMSCHNLIVQLGGRIRPVDWEWAAIGVPAWDVAKLLAGWTGADRDNLLEMYIQSFIRHSAVPLDRRAFDRTLAYSEMIHILWDLRWWVKRCHAPGAVERLLDKIEVVLTQGRKGA